MNKTAKSDILQHYFGRYIENATMAATTAFQAASNTVAVLLETRAKSLPGRLVYAEIPPS